MATVKSTLKPGDKLTAEQIKILEEAAKQPPYFDDDSPELTDEQLTRFKRVSEIRSEERRKKSVTLRLSPAAVKKARALGKGYTGVLARIVESALNDPDTLEKFL